MTAKSAKSAKSGRNGLQRALLLIVIGLIVQMFSLLHVTPASFLLFSFVGLGLVVLGIAWFIVTAVRARRAAIEADHVG